MGAGGTQGIQDFRYDGEKDIPKVTPAHKPEAAGEFMDLDEQECNQGCCLSIEVLIVKFTGR